ncbi:MAG: hypothetical protein QXG65_05800 [Thermoplasmata archaeon]
MDASEPDGPARAAAEARASRVALVLSLAADHRASLSVPELADLLPEPGRMDPDELEGWLRGRPDLARISEDHRVYQPGTEPRPAAETRRRADEYVAAARRLIDGPLADLRPSLVFVGISGSTAYSGPGPDDDLDLVVITSSGRLWRTLAGLFWRLRRARGRPGSRTPPICLNYARDRRTADREFRESRDLLFAREALAVVPVVGGDHYGRLLRDAAWMRGYLPGLYDRRLAEVAAGPADSPRDEPPPGIAGRIAEATAYVLLSTYFQTVGWARNRRLRRSGRPEAAFRTVTEPGRLSIDSVKFERIRSRYASESRSEARPGATAHDR